MGCGVAPSMPDKHSITLDYSPHKMFTSIPRIGQQASWGLRKLVPGSWTSGLQVVTVRPLISSGPVQARLCRGDRLQHEAIRRRLHPQAGQAVSEVSVGEPMGTGSRLWRGCRSCPPS